MIALPRSRRGYIGGLPALALLAIIIFLGLIIITYVFPQVWDELERLFRALSGK